MRSWTVWFLPLLLGSAIFAQPKKRRPTFATCQAQFRAHPDNWQSAVCFYNVSKRGYWERGEGLLSELKARNPDNGGVLFALGLVEEHLNRDGAEPHLRKAAEIFVASKKRVLEMYCWMNLARVLDQRGRGEESDALLAKAEELAKEEGNPATSAQIVLERARRLHRRGGSLAKAFDMLQAVEKDVFTSTSRSIRDEYLLLRGTVSFDLAQYDDALRDSQMLVQTSDNISVKASARLTQALAELMLFPRPGARERGAALLRDALEWAERGRQLGILTRVHLVLGLLSSGAKREWHIREAVRIAKESGDLAKISVAQQDLALLEAATDPAAGEATLEEALANAVQSGDVSVRIRANFYRMKLSWQTDTLEKALEDSARAMDEIEGLRDLQDTPDGRLGTLSRRLYDQYWLHGKLLSQDPVSRDFQERAFSLAERGRARVLLDSLKGAPKMAGPEERYDFASLAQVQQTLAPNEAMLSYRIAPWKSFFGSFAGGAWLLAITRKSVRVYRLPEVSEMEDKVALLRDFLVQRDNPVAMRVAMTTLYQELLAPALEDLPKEVSRLLIIPDQTLSLLPFAALRASPEDEPLVCRYRISQIPSATLWLRWRANRIRADHSAALILADPKTARSGDAGASIESTGEALRLKALPYAAWEGRELVRRLGDGGSSLRVGSEASEAFLKSVDLTRYGILHFAAHAFVDDNLGKRSAIALSPGNGQEDGYLEPREIAALNLSGRVVILSSCETASGAVVRGEGVMSLARAFFSAGAPAVVGSLWRLRDDDAAMLFTTFYGYLADGLSVDEALAAAQRELAAAGEPECAWSSAVVLGDGSVTPLPRPSGLPASLGLLVGLATLVWTMLKLRRLPARR